MKTISSSLLSAAAVGLALVLLPVAAYAQASKPGWSENEAQALEKAKSDKKMVLMDFTGSDWCGWCQKMDREVFATPEFKTYAQTNLVLVELDYPHEKFQSPTVKDQNAALKQQYGIRGFPTLIVLDSQGKMLKTFGGYQAGGASAFIAALERLKTGGSTTTQAAPAAPATQTVQATPAKPAVNPLGTSRIQASQGL